MPSGMGTGETGIRSVAANLILGQQGALVLKRTASGYKLAGQANGSYVLCNKWSEVERVLLRLNVPFHKIDEIAGLVKAGTDVIVHREIGK